MNDDLRFFLNDWLILSSVYSLVDADNGYALRALSLRFKGCNRRIDIDINDDTDEVVLSVRGDEAFPLGSEWGVFQPLSGEIAGLGVRWFWELTNASGYTDGIQFQVGPEIGEKTSPNVSRTIQLLVVASALDVKEVFGY